MTKEELKIAIVDSLAKAIGDNMERAVDRSVSIKEQQEVQDYRLQLLDSCNAQTAQLERIADAVERIAEIYRAKL